MNLLQFKKFYELTRGYTLLMSIMPTLVILAIYVVYYHAFDFGTFAKCILLLIGVISAHMFTNLFDDYVDIKKKLLKNIPLNQINFKSKRKARLILNGEFSIKNVEMILISLAIIALIAGFYFVFSSGAPVLVFIALGAFFAILYPFSTKIGISEIIIAIMFGPLLMLGAFYALTGTYAPYILPISLASGIITSILSITHSIMDYEFDKPENKKTIPVLIGKEGAIALIEGLIIIAHFLILMPLISSIAILGFLTFIPFIFTILLSVKLILSLIDYINIKDVPFIPKWYLGQMEGWEKIKENNYEFYMYRFYLARNLAIFFNAAIIISMLICLYIQTNTLIKFIFYSEYLKF